MYEIIKNAAKDVYNFRLKMEKIAMEKREVSDSLYFKDMVEQEIIKEVSPLDNFSFSVAAVDSGVYKKEVHNFQILLIRTMATIFEYERSYLKSSKNVPEIAKPRVEVLTEEEVDSVRMKNLIRLEEEIKMAIAVLEEKVDIMLLDGSLLPLVSDRPREDSSTFSKFVEVCGLYKDMIEKAMKNSVLLAGIIKDARSNKFLKSLNIEKGIDTFFLDFFLRKGERTTVFKHTREDRLLFKLIPDARDVLVFYIKASSYDRPLRVEFIPSSYSFDQIASIIYTLSSISEHYSYPSVLFEVDKRVSIKKEEIDAIEKQISFYSEFAISPLRRNSRPFKR